MTLRTYRYFVCSNGHDGIEKTSENDQPYSANWESVTITGMREMGKDFSRLRCIRLRRVRATHDS